MRLWIRADASGEIGLGHVMRTLALAEEARAQGDRVSYVSTEDASAALPERHGFEVVRIESSDDLSWLANVESGATVVFDGYHFTEEDMIAAKASGAVVGAIDDLGSGSFPVDVLLNPNPFEEVSYDTLPGTKVLLGPRYALVRAEFRRQRRLRSATEFPLLITMGGSDIARLSGPVAQSAVRSSRFDEVILVLGPATPILESLSTKVELIVDPPELARVFDRAEAAVTAAGSTTWELLCMGTPLGLIQVANNQVVTGPAVQRLGAGCFIGGVAEVEDRIDEALDYLADTRIHRRLSARALELVDGKGAKRFIDALVGI